MVEIRSIWYYIIRIIVRYKLRVEIDAQSAKEP